MGGWASCPPSPRIPADSPGYEDARRPRPRPRRAQSIRATSVLILASAALAVIALGPASALADDCPNAQLRAENNSTALPECRAYELVTPSFKEGFAAIAPTFNDEGALALTSNGNFSGVGNGTVANQYVSRRTPAGWQTTSPNPPGPAYVPTIGGGAEALSTDLRSTLWLMRDADESSDLEYFYLRRPDGTFTRIGPSFNPAFAPPGTPGPGSPETGPNFPVQASADLTHIVFGLLPALVFPGDPSIGDSLYEYTGTGNERPQLVGVDNTGNLVSPGGTCSEGISNDGRVVLFNPDGCDNTQLWARINETTSIDASASLCTRTAGDPGGVCTTTGEVLFGGAAEDGSRVFFTTARQLVNTDTDQSTDLYACDIPPGTPAPEGLANPCASLNEITGPTTGADVQQVIKVSSDGSRVYFTARGVLANNLGTDAAAPVAGEENLYVSRIDAAHPAGQTTFITRLQANDLAAVQSTADGRYLVFATTDRLLGSDTDEAADVYRYDAATRTLQRLSTDISGTAGNTPGMGVVMQNRGAITANGSTVVFQTAEALSPADTNGTVDIYAWHEGLVSLISSGRPALELPAGTFSGISPSGTDIYFSATAQLTPADGDTTPDIYDARVDGGFSFPTARSCTGEECAPPLAAQPPALRASGTGVSAGPGTPAPPPAPPVAKPGPRPLSKAQKLARALRACRARHDRRRRAACERSARHSYGRTTR